MRTLLDQLAKQTLDTLLRTQGPVEINKEVAGEVQMIDVWFAGPDRQPDPARPIGLLDRLAEGAALFEPFSRTPGLRPVLACTVSPLQRPAHWLALIAKSTWVRSTLKKSIPM